MPEVKLNIGADISQINVQFRRVGEEAEKMGQKAAKSFDWLGGLDKKLEALPKKLMTVMAAVTAVGEAAKIANTVAEQRAGYASATNAQNISSAQAAARMGGSVKGNMAFINEYNKFTTAEGRLNFAQSVAQIQDERRAQGLPGIPDSTIQRYQNLYRTGGDIPFGQNGGDLVNALRTQPYAPDLILGRQLAGRKGIPYTGQDVNSLLSANLKDIPESARVALAQQALKENEVTSSAYYEGGTAEAQNALMAKTVYEGNRIIHPYATAGLEATQGVPVLGELSKAGARKRSESQGKDIMEQIKDSIDKQTLQMGPVLPNLDARGRDPNVLAP